jgi:hypothetical protein
VDSAQLLQWLIAVIGGLIATLWLDLRFEVRRLRDELETLKGRVNQKADQDALPRLADRIAESEKDLRHEIREGSRGGYAREQYLSESDVQRTIDRRFEDMAWRLAQQSAQAHKVSQQGTNSPDNDGGVKLKETVILGEQNVFLTDEKGGAKP